MHYCLIGNDTFDALNISGECFRPCSSPWRGWILSDTTMCSSIWFSPTRTTGSSRMETGRLADRLSNYLQVSQTLPQIDRCPEVCFNWAFWSIFCVDELLLWGSVVLFRFWMNVCASLHKFLLKTCKNQPFKFSSFSTKICLLKF